MASKKRLLTSAIALGTAAALTLGGTFAWQSISQKALNEGSDVVNPGGRLHDDFDGENKDVYVENFAQEDIFARVRLWEYFEIVLNDGTKAEKPVYVIGSKTEKTGEDGQPLTNEAGETLYDYQYALFKDYQKGNGTEAGRENDGEDDYYAWWHWDMGGETVFMPTFNKNKDSLKADINGQYKFETGVITDKDVEGGQYTDMAIYEAGQIKRAHAIYDIDSNGTDEIETADLSQLISGDAGLTDEQAKAVKLVEEEHTAKTTASGSLMSMEDWLDMVERDSGYDPEKHGNYWVYDEDGWVYWSAPIKAGEASGLLLDGIRLNQVMDDSWYYAIDVEAQFITADDAGYNNNTGFYEKADEKPGEAAEKLLDLIGVDLGKIHLRLSDCKLVDEGYALYFTGKLTMDGEPVTLQGDNANLQMIVYEPDTMKSFYSLGRNAASNSLVNGQVKIHLSDGESEKIRPYLEKHGGAYFAFTYNDGVNDPITADKMYLRYGDDDDKDDKEEVTTHTLTIEDVTAGQIDVWDVGEFSGDAGVVFTAFHDETEVKKDYTKVTVHVQKNGDANATELTAALDRNIAIYDSKWNLYLDEIEGFTLDNGALTKYDIWLTYAEDDGTTTTSNKITCTFWKKTVALAETGVNDSLSKERTTLLAVDGMTMEQAMGDTEGNGDNSFLNKITVSKDGENVALTTNRDGGDVEDVSGTVDDAEVLKLEIRYETDVVIFKPGAAGTYVFTFTIDGTEYTGTITVTE